jgi:type I restriction enzyme, S subunit
VTSSPAVSNRNEVARWLSTGRRDQLIRAKYALRELDSRLGSKAGVLLSLSKERGIVPRAEFGDPAGRAENLSDYKVVEPGQIVMNKMQAWNGVFGLSALNGVVSPEYSVFTVLEGWDPRYVTYLLRSDFYVTQFAWRSRGMGTAFLRLHPENLLDTPLVAPDPQDQSRIADHLDEETGRIDRLVELIRARAAALVVRLAESTATALGDARWQSVPFKSVVSFREGPGVLSRDIREEGVPLLRIVNLRDDSILLDDLRYLDPEMVRLRWPHMRVRAGELIVSASATSGLPVIVPTEAEGAVPWTGLIRMWPSSDRLDRDYLQAYLGSTIFLSQVNALRQGIGLQHWGPSHLSEVRIPLPPVETQKEIAATTASERAVVREVRTVSEREVDLLIERRKALVTGAVTGQVRIRGAAA